MLKKALFNDVGAVNALGGASVNALLNTSLNSLVDDISYNELNNQSIYGDFDHAEAKRMEGLIRDRGIELLEPEHVIPDTIGTSDENVVKAFKDMSAIERARVLLGLGDPGAFNYTDPTTDKSLIYKGPSGLASASTLAHELGHAMNSADVADTIWEPIRDGAYALGNHTDWVAPLLMSAGAVGASDDLLLQGGVLGSALQLPMIAEELIASWRGKKFMEENGFKSNSWGTFTGVPTYLQSAITPLLPWVSRKAMRAMAGEYEM